MATGRDLYLPDALASVFALDLFVTMWQARLTPSVHVRGGVPARAGLARDAYVPMRGLGRGSTNQERKGDQVRRVTIAGLCSIVMFVLGAFGSSSAYAGGVCFKAKGGKYANSSCTTLAEGKIKGEYEFAPEDTCYDVGKGGVYTEDQCETVAEKKGKLDHKGAWEIAGEAKGVPPRHQAGIGFWWITSTFPEAFERGGRLECKFPKKGTVCSLEVESKEQKEKVETEVTGQEICNENTIFSQWRIKKKLPGKMLAKVKYDLELELTGEPATPLEYAAQYCAKMDGPIAESNGPLVDLIAK